MGLRWGGLEAGRKAVATLLCVVLLAQTAISAAAESNLWAERRDRRSRSDPPTLLASAVPPLSRPPAGPTFSAETVPSAALTVAGQPLLNHLLGRVPARYGSIRGVRWPKGRATRVVLHISDIHKNAEAQSNIADTLRVLAANGPLGIVALEGAFAPIDLTPFHAFPDRKTVQTVASDLLAEKKIPGPIAVAFDNPALNVQGVDDRAAYERNVGAARKALRERERAQSDLGREAARLRGEKRIFNSRLADLDASVEAHRNGTRSLGDHLAFLAKEAGDGTTPAILSFLEALEIERSLDFARVDREREQLLGALLPRLNDDEAAALVRAGVQLRAGRISHARFYALLRSLARSRNIDLSRTPAVSRYLRYVELTDGLNSETLLRDAAELESKVLLGAAITERERSLVRASRTLYLATRLADLALTPVEWREYESSERRANVRLSAFEDFYRAASERDALMARRLLDLIAADARPHILVTGGFHSAGIVPALLANGVAVVSYTPRLTSVPAGDQPAAYLSIFQRESTPVERLFSGEKIFLSDLALPVAVRNEGALRMVGTALHRGTVSFRPLAAWLRSALVRLEDWSLVGWQRTRDGVLLRLTAARRAFALRLEFSAAGAFEALTPVHSVPHSSTFLILATYERFEKRPILATVLGLMGAAVEGGLAIYLRHADRPMPLALWLAFLTFIHVSGRISNPADRLNTHPLWAFLFHGSFFSLYFFVPESRLLHVFVAQLVFDGLLMMNFWNIRPLKAFRRVIRPMGESLASVVSGIASKIVFALSPSWKEIQAWSTDHGVTLVGRPRWRDLSAIAAALKTLPIDMIERITPFTIEFAAVPMGGVAEPGRMMFDFSELRPPATWLAANRDWVDWSDAVRAEIQEQFSRLVVFELLTPEQWRTLARAGGFDFYFNSERLFSIDDLPDHQLPRALLAPLFWIKGPEGIAYNGHSSQQAVENLPPADADGFRHLRRAGTTVPIRIRRPASHTDAYFRVRPTEFIGQIACLLMFDPIVAREVSYDNELAAAFVAVEEALFGTRLFLTRRLDTSIEIADLQTIHVRQALDIQSEIEQPWNRVKWTFDQWERKKKSGHARGAFFDGRLLGVSQWRFEGPVAPGNPSELLLQYLAVHPAYRNMGIGTRLVGELQDLARRSQNSAVVVYVEETEEAELKFFRDLGFDVQQLLTAGPNVYRDVYRLVFWPDHAFDRETRTRLAASHAKRDKERQTFLNIMEMLNSWWWIDEADKARFEFTGDHPNAAAIYSWSDAEFQRARAFVIAIVQVRAVELINGKEGRPHRTRWQAVPGDLQSDFRQLLRAGHLWEWVSHVLEPENAGGAALLSNSTRAEILARGGNPDSVSNRLLHAPDREFYASYRPFRFSRDHSGPRWKRLLRAVGIAWIHGFGVAAPFLIRWFLPMSDEMFQAVLLLFAFSHVGALVMAWLDPDAAPTAMERLLLFPAYLSNVTGHAIYNATLGWLAPLSLPTEGTPEWEIHMARHDIRSLALVGDHYFDMLKDEGGLSPEARDAFLAVRDEYRRRSKETVARIDGTRGVSDLRAVRATLEAALDEIVDSLQLLTPFIQTNHPSPAAKIIASQFRAILATLSVVGNRFRAVGETTSEADLVSLMNDESPLWRFSAAGRAEVVVDSGAPGHVVRLQPSTFGWIIQNLVSNAGRAGATRIEIRQAALDNGTARITVADNGPGIPEALLAGALFENGTSGAGSTGTGLAFVKDAVQRWGGTVSATNPVSGGARFDIDLPLIHQSGDFEIGDAEGPAASEPRATGPSARDGAMPSRAPPSIRLFDPTSPRWDHFRFNRGLIPQFESALELADASSPTAGLQFGDIAIRRARMATFPPIIQRWYLRRELNRLWSQLRLRNIRSHQPSTRSSRFIDRLEGFAAGVVALFPALCAPHVSVPMIQEANRLLREFASQKPTRLVRAAGLSRSARKDVWVKLESDHVPGSFKARAAAQVFRWFEMMSPEERRRATIVVESTGNQGMAVAWAVQLLKKRFPEDAANLRAVVFASEHILQLKEKMNGLVAAGADLRVTRVENGVERPIRDYGDAHDAVLEMKAERGASVLHVQHGSWWVMAGYATMLYEVADQLEAAGKDESAVYVPVGSGGLIAGLQSAAHALRRRIFFRLVGVESPDVKPMFLARRGRRMVEDVEQPPKAKAHGIGVKHAEQIPIDIVEEADIPIDLVPFEEMERATVQLRDDTGEPTLEYSPGLAAAAAILRTHIDPEQNVVVIGTGGNEEVEADADAALDRVDEPAPLSHLREKLEHAATNDGRVIVLFQPFPSAELKDEQEKSRYALSLGRLLRKLTPHDTVLIIGVTADDAAASMKEFAWNTSANVICHTEPEILTPAGWGQTMTPEALRAFRESGVEEIIIGGIVSRLFSRGTPLIFQRPVGALISALQSGERPVRSLVPRKFVLMTDQRLGLLPYIMVPGRGPGGAAFLKPSASLDWFQGIERTLGDLAQLDRTPLQAAVWESFPPGTRVISFGIGEDPRWELELVRSGHHVTGIDSDPAAIRSAERRLLTEKLEPKETNRVDFRVMDLFAYIENPPTEPFDVVAINSPFTDSEWIQSLVDGRLAAAIDAVLRPGGRAFIYTEDDSYPSEQEAEQHPGKLKNNDGQAGLETIRTLADRFGPQNVSVYDAPPEGWGASHLTATAIPGARLFIVARKPEATPEPLSIKSDAVSVADETRALMESTLDGLEEAVTNHATDLRPLLDPLFRRLSRSGRSIAIDNYLTYVSNLDRPALFDVLITLTIFVLDRRSEGLTDEHFARLDDLIQRNAVSRRDAAEVALRQMPEAIGNRQDRWSPGYPDRWDHRLGYLTSPVLIKLVLAPRLADGPFDEFSPIIFSLPPTLRDRTVLFFSHAMARHLAPNIYPHEEMDMRMSIDLLRYGIGRMRELNGRDAAAHGRWARAVGDLLCGLALTEENARQRAADAKPFLWASTGVVDWDGAFSPAWHAMRDEFHALLGSSKPEIRVAIAESWRSFRAAPEKSWLSLRWNLFVPFFSHLWPWLGEETLEELMFDPGDFSRTFYLDMKNLHVLAKRAKGENPPSPDFWKQYLVWRNKTAPVEAVLFLDLVLDLDLGLFDPGDGHPAAASPYVVELDHEDRVRDPEDVLTRAPWIESKLFGVAIGLSALAATVAAEMALPRGLPVDRIVLACKATILYAVVLAAVAVLLHGHRVIRAFFEGGVPFVHDGFMKEETFRSLLDDQIVYLAAVPATWRDRLKLFEFFIIFNALPALVLLLPSIAADGFLRPVGLLGFALTIFKLDVITRWLHKKWTLRSLSGRGPAAAIPGLATRDVPATGLDDAARTLAEAAAVIARIPGASAPGALTAALKGTAETRGLNGAQAWAPASGDWWAYFEDPLFENAVRRRVAERSATLTEAEAGALLRAVRSFGLLSTSPLALRDELMIPIRTHRDLIRAQAFAARMSGRPVTLIVDAATATRLDLGATAGSLPVHISETTLYNDRNLLVSQLAKNLPKRLQGRMAEVVWVFFDRPSLDLTGLPPGDRLEDILRLLILSDVYQALGAVTLRRHLAVDAVLSALTSNRHA